MKLKKKKKKKITLDKIINLVTNTENEKYGLVKYRLIKKKKDKSTKSVEQVKMYDYEFDKRMVKYENENLNTSLPYGF